MKSKNTVLFTLPIFIIALFAYQFILPHESTQNANVSIHYIDVGQGDCELIQLPDNQNMLIDAGTNKSSETVIEYIKNLGITKLDYVVATHPHEDHIGGLDNVINSFEIGTIYMPKVSSNTKTYKDVLTAIDNKNLKIQTAIGGKNIIDSDNLKAEILSPNSDKYTDLNDYSVVIRLTYKDKSFIFMGDAQDTAEKEIIDKNYNLSSDVLKVGHHGSSTSTSDKLLQAINPKIAIISCGKNNDYGHPHRETLNILSKYKVKVYRTDEQGTITLDCDGQTIKVRD